MSTSEANLNVTVKWNGTEHIVDVHPSESVACLKRKLEASTGVEPRRQKLLGLKTSGGKLPNDKTLIQELALKSGVKIMMMGSVESNITALAENAEVAPHIQDDFDIPSEAADKGDIEDMDAVEAKVSRRVSSTVVKILQQPRQGKKLLVLDIDYTLFDLGSSAERPEELARPYLHHFLENAYRHYDIAIWSATSMKWVEVKIRELGVSTHPSYKLTFMLDCASMVTVRHRRYGLFDCKPLAYVWAKFPGVYTPDNTIMMDDLRRNYVLNPQNGLVIRAYRHSHRNRDRDHELQYLTEYLLHIAEHPSLADLDHGAWERVVRHRISEIRAERRARVEREQQRGG